MRIIGSGKTSGKEAVKNKWQEVWKRRSWNQSAAPRLQDLIQLDGYDSGAGVIPVGDWRDYTASIGKKLKLEDGMSIFEVGCGSGALLYSLSKQFDIQAGGVDYAKGLIEAARIALPTGNFEVREACDLDVEPQYDLVIANSVFHYFSLNYAKQVIDLMLAKARSKVVILEIPDIDYREQLELLRRDALGVEEYEEKYAGLPHTYYPREWFLNQLARDGCGDQIVNGFIPNYALCGMKATSSKYMRLMK